MLTPIPLMIVVQRADSTRICSAASAGEPVRGCIPSDLKCCCASGVNITSASAWLSLVTIGYGMCAGPTIICQVLAS
jgi:hypothetical protein